MHRRFVSPRTAATLAPRLRAKLASRIAPASRSHRTSSLRRGLLCSIAGGAAALLLAATPVRAQVITIDTSGKGPVAGNGPVEHEYRQVEPTHVELSKTELDPKTRLQLIRDMQSEQGFAMRPFPRGHKGLTLEANGKLTPAGEAYVNTVIGQ